MNMNHKQISHENPNFLKTQVLKEPLGTIERNIERTNERKNGRTNEPLNERADRRTNERTITWLLLQEDYSDFKAGIAVWIYGCIKLINRRSSCLAAVRSACSD